MHLTHWRNERPAKRARPARWVAIAPLLGLWLGCSTEVDYSASAGADRVENPAGAQGDESASAAPTAQPSAEQTSAEQTSTEEILDAIASQKRAPTAPPEEPPPESAPPGGSEPPTKPGPSSEEDGGARVAAAPDATPETPPASPTASDLAPPDAPELATAAPPRVEPAGDKKTEEAATSNNPGALPDELLSDRYAPSLFGGITNPAPEAPSQANTVADTREETEQNAPAPEESATEPGTRPDSTPAPEPTAAATTADWPPAALSGGFDPNVEPLFPSPSPPPQPAGEEPAPGPVQPIALDAANTRHLAWLLGAKAAVVTLGELAGVDAARQSRWEVDALAEMLQVARPNDPAELSRSPTPEAAIAGLIRQARTTAQQLSQRHGPDHAALMEISLKTNALLILYDSRPSLAEPVFRAVQAASGRAGLPPNTLTRLTRALQERAGPDEVHQAVHSVHREVERLLRAGLASSPAGPAPTASGPTASGPTASGTF